MPRIWVKFSAEKRKPWPLLGGYSNDLVSDLGSNLLQIYASRWCCQAPVWPKFLWWRTRKKVLSYKLACLSHQTKNAECPKAYFHCVFVW